LPRTKKGEKKKRKSCDGTYGDLLFLAKKRA